MECMLGKQEGKLTQENKLVQKDKENIWKINIFKVF